MKNVTIIVPVYKDWDSLEICIDSLRKYVDQRHKVLLVNDKGPDWMDLERKILQKTADSPNFCYFANPCNLGFVKTCNRAVFELDGTGHDILLLNSDTRVTEGFLEEMQWVLYACKMHGIVCPRSNQATILTMPLHHSLGRPLREEESYAVYKQVSPMLPRYGIIPTGVGFAFLVRRELIRMFGLFDEAYSPGYGEENDFCMRVGQHGYSVAMANHAYVYHFESRSFGTKRTSIGAKHHKILTGRYPYYLDMVSEYMQGSIHPLDFFADLAAEGVYDKKRILFSLYEIPTAYNGASQYALSLLKYFSSLYGDKYELHVLIRKKADAIFKISSSYANVWHPDDIQGTFHLVYSPLQIVHLEHLCLLNRICLKYVFCIQDMITLRSSCQPAESRERKEVLARSIRYCAGLTFMSKDSLKDAAAYYPELFECRRIEARVIRYGAIHCGSGNHSSGCISNCQPVRTWAEAAKELELFLGEILSGQTGQDLLMQRWEDMRCMEMVMKKYAAGQDGAGKAGVVYRFKIYLYGHYPRIFLFLKKGKQLMRQGFKMLGFHVSKCKRTCSGKLLTRG